MRDDPMNPDPPFWLAVIVLTLFVLGAIFAHSSNAGEPIADDDWKLWEDGKAAVKPEPPRYQLVMFTADWCGPCITTKAMLKREKIDYVAIDTDNHPGLVQSRKIAAIPCLVLEMRVDGEWKEVRRVSHSLDSRQFRERFPELKPTEPTPNPDHNPED